MTAAELYALIDVLKDEVRAERLKSRMAAERGAVAFAEMELRLRLAETYIPEAERAEHDERDRALRRNLNATRAYR